jgi:hypothetical protein
MSTSDSRDNFDRWITPIENRLIQLAIANTISIFKISEIEMHNFYGVRLKTVFSLNDDIGPLIQCASKLCSHPVPFHSKIILFISSSLQVQFHYFQLIIPSATFVTKRELLSMQRCWSHPNWVTQIPSPKADESVFPANLPTTSFPFAFTLWITKLHILPHRPSITREYGF